jgi:hypothetical protein
MPSPLHLHLGECLPRGAFRTPRDGRLQEFPRILLIVSFLLCLICTSCGAVGSGPAPPPPVTVTVMPNSAQLFPGGNKQFDAVVENTSSSAVTWQLSQPSGGITDVGTISSSGYYTAPNLVPNQATVTVTAVLQSDSTKTGSAIVTLQSLSSIQGPLTLSPKLSSVTTSQTLQLDVLTAGVSNSDMSWSVACVPVGGCSTGTITQSGLFTPPNAKSSNIVAATLIANPSAIGSATVEVTDFPGTLTWRNNNSRSGVNSQELALAQATVNSSTFGKLFSCTIDGYAYAEPLYVPNLLIPGKGTHNVIFVATEMDSVYAFDADANPCKKLWKTSLIPTGSQAIAFPNQIMTGTDIVPFVGITGTPVIDPSTFTMYVVAATQTIATTAVLNPTYSLRIHALALTAVPPEMETGGVPIATPPGQTPPFDATVENQRPALLLDNGIVYVSFGSYGGTCVIDPETMAPCPYHGWMFGYDSSSLQQTGVFDVAPDAVGLPGGGIWQSGGGPSADSNGSVFVVTGDGPFGSFLGGMNFSDSFLRLVTSGGLSVSDFFTPCDQAALEAAGQDVGASAPVLVLNSTSQPDLLIGGSKNGSLYIVNPDNMGGFESTCQTDLPPRVQVIPLGAGPILSSPLFWNNFVYVAPGNSNLMSFPISGGIFAAPPPASQSPETLGPQGATPVISSNGTSNAILWLIDSSGAVATPNAPAILREYDPNNLSNEIYNSAMVPSRDQAGLAVKFTVPTVANGKVYVGTQTELDVYGLLQ